MGSPEVPPKVAHLIGPIHGIEDFRQRFEGAAIALKRQGYIVTSPLDVAKEQADQGPDVPPGTLVYHAAMINCFIAIFAANEVWALLGWANSVGACTEMIVSIMVGKPVFEQSTGRRIPEREGLTIALATLKRKYVSQL